MNRNMLVGGGGICWSLMMLAVILPIGVSMPDSVEIAALSPVFWPRIIVVLAGIASAFLLVQGVQQMRRGKRLVEKVSEYYAWPTAVWRALVVLALVFGIYFSIEYLGLVIPSMICLAVLIRFAGEKSMIRIFSIAILLPLILFLFFQFVASVPIPLGEIVYYILPE